MKSQKKSIKNAVMILWTLFPFAKAKHNPFNNTDTETGGQFKLYANYPNPFSTITIIYFALMHPSRTQINLFNAGGKKLLTLTDENMQAGIQRVPLYRVINNVTLTTGIYQYQLVVTNLNGTYKQTQTLNVI